MKRSLMAAAAAAVLIASDVQVAGASPCQPPRQIADATPEQVRAFFAADGRTVVTFLGYSGAGYEDPAGMLAHAGRALDRLDPRKTIVNIGATAEGIGAVYELAKRRGFATTGIVSSEAKRSGATLSPCVDTVFFITDSTWGGYLPGTRTLSPTSSAMVAASGRLVAIGGGEVARDELRGARAAGTPVSFYAADMNHALALEKARAKGLPAPADFGGAAREAFTTAPR
jgi:hypothetical protein